MLSIPLDSICYRNWVGLVFIWLLTVNICNVLTELKQVHYTVCRQSVQWFSYQEYRILKCKLFQFFRWNVTKNLQENVVWLKMPL